MSVVVHALNQRFQLTLPNESKTPLPIHHTNEDNVLHVECLITQDSDELAEACYKNSVQLNQPLVYFPPQCRWATMTLPKLKCHWTDPTRVHRLSNGLFSVEVAEDGRLLNLPDDVVIKFQFKKEAKAQRVTLYESTPISHLLPADSQPQFSVKRQRFKCVYAINHACIDITSSGIFVNKRHRVDSHKTIERSEEAHGPLVHIQSVYFKDKHCNEFFL